LNNIEKEVKIIKFRGDPSKMKGIVEVRGIVNKDGTISYGEFTQYDDEFGKSCNNYIEADILTDFYIELSTHELMLDYYHGMCRDLCIK
jgi:hypothetical protein